MNIEFARPEDRQELKEIYHACFPGDPDSFWDFELDCRMEPDNILIYREQGRILSTVQLLPEHLTLNGTAYPVQYIYAAATLPEAQGRGLMGFLLRYAHDLARERGQRFSVLITQNDGLFDFYARFGYRDCGKLGCLPASCQANAVGKVRQAQPGDLPKMLELYRAGQKNVLSVARTDEAFAMQQAVYEKSVLVYEAQGLITAYGFKVGKRMLEVMGPGGAELLAASGSICGYTVPRDDLDLVRNGCVLPLDQEAVQLLAQQKDTVYLNLMWN